jgi:hypothetical protein
MELYQRRARLLRSLKSDYYQEYVKEFSAQIAQNAQTKGGPVLLNGPMTTEEELKAYLAPFETKGILNKGEVQKLFTYAMTVEIRDDVPAKSVVDAVIQVKKSERGIPISEAISLYTSKKDKEASNRSLYYSFG